MTKTIKTQPTNHRVRVGQKRSAMTRTRLLQGALPVFASHGVDASVIHLIIKNAGVSRGTFYNYFRTNEELFFAVAEKVSSELIHIVEPVVRLQSDPAARIACGVKLVVKLAKSYPLFAQFIVRGGPAAICAGSLATEVVPGDIREGLESGRFSVKDERVALDLLLGPVLMAFNAILTEGISDSYPQELAQAILQSLGMTKSTAGKLASTDFGDVELPEDSLFVQAQKYVQAN